MTIPELNQTVSNNVTLLNQMAGNEKPAFGVTKSGRLYKMGFVGQKWQSLKNFLTSGESQKKLDANVGRVITRTIVDVESHLKTLDQLKGKVEAEKLSQSAEFKDPIIGGVIFGKPIPLASRHTTSFEEFHLPKTAESLTGVSDSLKRIQLLAKQLHTPS